MSELWLPLLFDNTTPAEEWEAGQSKTADASSLTGNHPPLKADIACDSLTTLDALAYVHSTIL